MPWIEINADEYRTLYVKEKDKLSVYYSATFMAGDYIGERWYPEDYFETTWGFNADEPMNFIRSLKDLGEWHYWKWEGLMMEESNW